MACAASTDADPKPATGRRDIDLDVAWRLHPLVDIRPERFGALMYHYGTRQLTFVKSPKMVAVLKELASAPSAQEAMRQAEVPLQQFDTYQNALRGLAVSGVICERS